MTRLLSPMKRRIYPNARTGTGIANAGQLVQKQREGHAEGEADVVTVEALVKLGWKPYDGPGRTDARGYIVPGSDPKAGI